MVELGIAGAGNMGLAIIRGIVRGGVVPLSGVLVAEVDGARRRAAADLGCRVTADAADLRVCSTLLLAVKPQSFPDVADALGALDRPAVVISIMAGISSTTIRRSLGPPARVVRVMPNTPCQIGLGVSGLALGVGARPGDEALARRLFETMGAVVDVLESQMHAVTALSGSGPAYVFRLAELMEAAGVEVGLAPQQARTLAVLTVQGAGALLARSGESAAALRQAVTSPGGTTAAALEVMEERGMALMMVDAIRRARDRGAELDG